MKKEMIIISLSLGFILLALGGFPEDYVLARFRLGQQQDLEVYYPGGVADELTTCTYFQRSWNPVSPSGGWLDNQFKAPDIATPPVQGPEGGNALFGNSNEDSSTREGYWMQFFSPIRSSFTFEVFFYLDVLNPNFAEYKMQNIVSSFWMSDGKGVELRTQGDFSGGGIQLMTNDGGVEHNITSSAGVITADKWYYAAVVYNHDASEISFYLADASDPNNITPTLVGTTDPNWGDFAMHWLCLGAWPNAAGSCRDISGYIDAFGLSFETLSPSNFLLLNLPSLPTNARESWNLYQ